MKLYTFNQMVNTVCLTSVISCVSFGLLGWFFGFSTGKALVTAKAIEKGYMVKVSYVNSENKTITDTVWKDTQVKGAK